MNENIVTIKGKAEPAISKTDKNEYEISAKLIISAAVFGIAFSYLFTRQTMGLNMFLFVLFVYTFAAFNKDCL